MLGGLGNDGTNNGVGLIATGGSNLSVTYSDGADAIQATGGAGSPNATTGGSNGGNGITSTGGSAGAFLSNGGNGIVSTGGAGSTVGNIGGTGVVATGGATLGDGGVGVIAQGGQGTNFRGGDGIDATGGSGATSGLAGSFTGDVMVTGTLTAATLVATTTKKFKIEDPIDPTKYLFHSTVESSEMINIYSGMVVVDHKGEAVVTLPKWFEALNGDFRYQLTCIGAWAPLYIAKKIAHNQFVIGGGQAGMEVSWQVTGVRHDAAAKANPLVVEMAKTDDPFYRRETARAKMKASAAKRTVRQRDSAANRPSAARPAT